MRSLPENSATNRSGSGWPASESAASRRPAAQPSVRAWSLTIDSSEACDPRGGEQFSRLVEREAQVGCSHLGQLAGEAQAMQTELGIAARGEHDLKQAWPAVDQESELSERLRRLQLLQVVEDEQHRFFQRAELGDEAFDHGFAVELRRRRQLLDERIGADGGAQLLDHREPEPLGISLTAFDGDPGDVVGQSRLIDPGAKEHGLAAAGRRRDERDSRRAARRETFKQPPPGDQRGPVSADRSVSASWRSRRHQDLLARLPSSSRRLILAPPARLPCLLGPRARDAMSIRFGGCPLIRPAG